jgi:hypothetical protein
MRRSPWSTTTTGTSTSPGCCDGRRRGAAHLQGGSVTHFEGEVLVEDIQRFVRDEELDGSYDGHANCFIETGFHKAMLIDLEPARD